MAFHYAIIYGNALKQAHYTLFSQTMQDAPRVLKKSPTLLADD